MALLFTIFFGLFNRYKALNPLIPTEIKTSVKIFGEIVWRMVKDKDRVRREEKEKKLKILKKDNWPSRNQQTDPLSTILWNK